MADDKLFELGFICVESNVEGGYWIYQNPDKDKEVWILHDLRNEWHLAPCTISTNGGEHDVESMSVPEIQAFLAKIEDLRKE